MTLTAGDLELAGHLAIPDRATGAVIFAHGSGSSRRSPRNRLVAAALNQAGLGTLLADLLTPEEELRRADVFDVRLLAARLTGITRWLHRHPAALWATSARARAPPRPCGRLPPTRGCRSRRSSPAAADPTWPGRGPAEPDIPGA